MIKTIVKVIAIDVRETHSVVSTSINGAPDAVWAPMSHERAAALAHALAHDDQAVSDRFRGME